MKNTYSYKKQHNAFTKYLTERFDGDEDEVANVIEIAELIIPNTLHDYFGTPYESIYEIHEIDEVDEFRRKIKVHPILKNIDMNEEPRYSEVLKWYRLFLKSVSSQISPILTSGEHEQNIIKRTSQISKNTIISKQLSTIYLEGEVGETQEKIYRERNRQLRQACIDYYKSLHDGRIVCECCGFDFSRVYDIDDEYIEIHHLFPFSQTEGEHSVDALKDLVPLCANCHRMIHHGMGGNGNCMSLDDLKKIYKGNTKI